MTQTWTELNDGSGQVWSEQTADRPERIVLLGEGWPDALAGNYSDIFMNSTAMSTAAFTSLQGEVARSFEERGREHMSMLDFVTDARGGSARRMIILAGTFQSGADDTDAVQAALDWANDDATGRWLFVPGDFICQRDLTGVHTVNLYGPGSIKVGTGARWYVSPTKLNTGFSPLGYNTIYVSATGSDTASGMAPEFAVLTGAKAIEKFVYAQSGFKRIIVAKGVYRDSWSLSTVESSKVNKIIIQGPTRSAWDNSAAPKPVTISAITSANPAVVTAAGHGRSIGDEVFIYDAVTGSAAEHGSIGRIHTVTNVSGNDLTLDVDGSAWAAYSSAGKLVPILATSPTAIFLGAKNTATYAINQDSSDHVEYSDLTFVNWGTKTSSTLSPQNAGGIVVATGYAALTNVHAYGCAHRVTARDYSRVLATSGYVYDCSQGDWAVGGARVTFGGTANPSDATSTATTLYEECDMAWDFWEDTSGHCDGSIVKNCTSIGRIYTGSHVVAYYNRYTNTTGSPLLGWDVRGNLSRSDGTTDVVTGEFADLIDRKAGGTLIYSGDTGINTRRQKTLLLRDLPNTTTADGTERTVTSYTIPQNTHVAPYSNFEFKARFVLNNTTGNVVIRVKVAGSSFYTYTIPPYASQQSGELEVIYTKLSTGFARASAKIKFFETATGTVTYERFSNYVPGFDPSAGSVAVSMTMNVAAGNTGQCHVCEFWSDSM